MEAGDFKEGQQWGSVGSRGGGGCRICYNGSFTPNNLLPTVRSDCKKLGAAPIASNGRDSREKIYLKIITVNKA